MKAITRLPQRCDALSPFARQHFTTSIGCRQPLVQRRPFLSNPFAPTQNLQAMRVLPYPSKVIYEVITDVASYKHFIPYCISSEVLKYSNPTEDGRRWPEEAKLVIGFNGDVSEAFWSRVYCVPETIVETVAGGTETSLAEEQIKHHNPRLPPGEDPVRKGNVMKHLSTKWTLRPYHYKPPPTSAINPDSTHKNHDETSPLPGQEKTEVSVKIDYEFANPVYSALSAAASSKVADKMIEAFEKRVKAVIEGPGHIQ